MAHGRTPDHSVIAQELAVTKGLRSNYGTNQPQLTYEDGIAAALQWVLGEGVAPNDAPFEGDRFEGDRYES
jgi:hypothetical protein